MPNAAQEAKIELVTESIEALALATVVATLPGASDSRERAANHQNVVDAREVLRKSLRELLAPALRVLPTSNEHKVICTKDRCHCGPQ